MSDGKILRYIYDTLITILIIYLAYKTLINLSGDILRYFIPLIVLSLYSIHKFTKEDNDEY